MQSIEIFPWSDRFNTGLDVIDHQHRRLVELLNQLASQAAFDASCDSLLAIFDGLADYAHLHFTTEEAIWARYLGGDQQEQDHVAAHRGFTATVARLRGELGTRASHEVAEEALGYLARWLAAHILEQDRHIAWIALGMRSGLGLAEARAEAVARMAGDARELVQIILTIYGALTANTLKLMRELAERKKVQAELDRHRTHLEELVTERTAKLAARERHLNTMLREIPGAMAYWDAHQACRFANRTYHEWLGREPGSIEGHTIREVRGEEAWRLELPRIESVLRGEPQEFERPIAGGGPGAPQRVSRVHYVPDIDGGRVAGFFVMAFDITDLAHAREQAEAANVAKTAFLANMSHEIRTPLNAITGLAHLIRRSGVSPEQATRLERIDAAGRYLLNTINAILDLSKIEAGKLRLEESAVDVPLVVRSVVAVLGEQARAKGIELRTDVPGDLPAPLLGDPTRLQEALVNYVDNAIKFSTGGTVSIRVRVADLDPQGALLRLEVHDNGMGIAPDVQPRLFSTFEQADNTTTRRFGGTGLGLTITRRLALLMGGNVGVTSRLGEGSTFWLTARLRLGQAQGRADPWHDISAADAEAVLRRDYGGTRILLVEDDPVGIEVQLSLLSGLGLAVDTARNGREAFEKAAAGGYDLVLMDMHMPVMDGLEATRLLRATARGKYLPVVALTANAFDEDRRACLDAGMIDFVTKPIEPQALFATLIRWLPPRAAPGQSAPAPVAGTPPSPAAAPTLRVVAPADPGASQARSQLATLAALSLDDGLKLVGGDPQRLLKLLHKFSEGQREAIATLVDGSALGDPEGLRALAHRLKGTGGTLGLKGVQACAAAIEQHLKGGGQPDACAAQVAELATTLVGLDEALASLKPPAPTPPPAHAQAVAATGSGGAPVKASLAALRDLADLLAADSVGAGTCLEENRSAIHALLDDNTMARLEREVGEFDFPAALATVRIALGARP